MMLIVGALIVFTLLVIWLGIASRSDIMVSIWMRGGFLLRNFWFIGFELGQRPATPGKRRMGIRVVTRDGGRLTADAVGPRHLIREPEPFLPLTMITVGEAEASVAGWTGFFGLGWARGPTHY